MIRSHFAITADPFATDPKTPLLSHQQAVFDIVKVHNLQGGFCVILGEPGSGKTVLKNAVIHHRPKEWVTPVINRSLHTWPNILRLLCEALELDASGSNQKCERRLIEEARKLHAKGKIVIPIIDDAHLAPLEALRKLRLLFEDFPKNHNLILLGQPQLNDTLQLRVNEDIRNRITYSAILPPLGPSAIREFIFQQLDRVGLAHATFSEAAIHLIARSSEGVLRSVKNLCVGAMIESAGAGVKTVDTSQVNAVLMQPHWRASRDREQHDGVRFVPDKPGYSSVKQG